MMSNKEKPMRKVMDEMMQEGVNIAADEKKLEVYGLLVRVVTFLNRRRIDNWWDRAGEKLAEFDDGSWKISKRKSKAVREAVFGEPKISGGQIMAMQSAFGVEGADEHAIDVLKNLHLKPTQMEREDDIDFMNHAIELAVSEGLDNERK